MHGNIYQFMHYAKGSNAVNPKCTLGSKNPDNNCRKSITIFQLCLLIGTKYGTVFGCYEASKWLLILELKRTLDTKGGH